MTGWGQTKSCAATEKNVCPILRMPLKWWHSKPRIGGHLFRWFSEFQVWHFAGLTDFFGFIWASKNGGRWWNQSHHALTWVLLPLCHSNGQRSFVLVGEVANVAGNSLLNCAVTLDQSCWCGKLSRAQWFLDQRTARFARNRKHPSIDHVEVSSEKQGSFSNDLTGKRPLLNINPPSTCPLENVINVAFCSNKFKNKFILCLDSSVTSF